MMKYFLYWLLLICCLSNNSLSIPTHSPTSILIPSTLSSYEYAALNDFYVELSGPNWVWKTDSPGEIPWNFVNSHLDNPCTDNWAGVSCSCEDNLNPLVQAGYCYVARLNLTFHNLTGTLPASIGNLLYIIDINLAENWISGSLPLSLRNLTQLQSLSLYNNRLRGRLSNLLPKNWKMLQHLDLHNNFFIGHLPSDFYGLINLRNLDLGRNNFTGTISPNIANLQQLQSIDLHQNSFWGIVLPSLTEILDILYIYIDDNSFSSTLPVSLNNLTKLVGFNIGFNQFSGTIPDTLGECWSQLRVFSLSKNRFYGQLPSTIGVNMTSILKFMLAFNEFTGPLPDTLLYTHFQTIQILYVDNNKFTGTFSGKEFAQMTLLNQLSFESNLFSGSIEYLFNAHENLHSAAFSSNLFAGPLPLFNITAISYIVGEYNEFTGTVPNYLAFSKRLKGFSMSYNLLTGTIPDWQGELPMLLFIAVGYNFITSTIPNTFYNTTVLQDILYNDNFLTQSIPPSASNIKQLTELYLQNNMLTGSIPKDIYAIIRLEILYVQNNFISGPLLPQYNVDIDDDNGLHPNRTIPKLLQSSLINVDVSNNKFTGTVPPMFFRFAPKLRAYVLSSNCFIGSIPSTICEALALTSLALDGLGSAEACQTPLFPHIPYFTSFRASTSVTGGVPACLFQMPNLEILRLSGNGLTGSLPAELSDPKNISLALRQLSLANNDLTGSIPAGVQLTSWIDLDLSFNKLDGTLLSNFAPILPNASISLQINRLSGDIPSAFLQSGVGSINMLVGNIFNCQDLVGNEEKKLPEDDPNRDIYSCGSDTINRALFLWLILALGFFLLVICCFSMLHTPFSDRGKNRKSKRISKLDALSVQQQGDSEVPIDRSSLRISSWMRDTFVGKLSIANTNKISTQPWYWQPWMDDVRDYIAVLSNEETKNGNEKENEKCGKVSISKKEALFQLVYFFRSIRFIFSILTVFLIFVLLPWCELLTSTLGGGTYTFEYAWSTSAILQSGDLSGASLFVAFTTVSVITVLSFEFCFGDYALKQQQRNYSVESSGAKEQQQLWTQKYCGYFFATAEQLMDVEYLKRRFENRVVLSLIGILNLSSMILIDILYVILILNSSAVVVFFAQFGLGTFKLIWNDIVLWKSIPLLKYLLFRKFSNNNNEHFSVSTYKYSKPELSFMIVMILLNNIVIPCMSIAVVSSDCYYNAFFAEPPVTSTTLYECNYVVNFGVFETCLGESSSTEDISYYPPFNYRYQCSGAFIINYAEVYVYMFILVGLILPAGKIMLKLLHDKLIMEDNNEVDPRISMQSSVMSPVLGFTKENNRDGSGTDSELTIPMENHVTSSKWRTRLLDLIKSIMPENLQDIEYKNDIGEVDESNQEPSDANSKEEPTSSFFQNRVSSISHRMVSIVRDATASMAIFTTPTLHEIIGEGHDDNGGGDEMLVASSPGALDEKEEKALFFYRNKFMVKMQAYLAIMLTFGTIFPPLSFLICTAAFTTTWYEHLVLGRVLVLAKRHRASILQQLREQQFRSKLGNSAIDKTQQQRLIKRMTLVKDYYRLLRQKLNKEVNGIAVYFSATMWVLLMFGCLSYAFVLFDTFGNVGGWTGAFVPTLLMALLPIILYLFHHFVRLRFMSDKSESENVAENAGDKVLNPVEGNDDVVQEDRESMVQLVRMSESKHAL